MSSETNEVFSYIHYSIARHNYAQYHDFLSGFKAVFIQAAVYSYIDDCDWAFQITWDVDEFLLNIWPLVAYITVQDIMK